MLTGRGRRQTANHTPVTHNQDPYIQLAFYISDDQRGTSPWTNVRSTRGLDAPVFA
jgi:hypothetical protein